MKVFVDTKVLLDVLGQRNGFYENAQRIWARVESGELVAHVSVISFTNCYYVIRKSGGKPAAEEAMRLIRTLFRPVDLTSTIIDSALAAGFTDFEDAIQYQSALEAGAECLITRDLSHFPRHSLPILSPTEFLGLSAES